MAKLKLFQYAILWHPTEKQMKDEDLKTKLLVEPTIILAADEKSAGMMAVMEIPAEKKGEIDQIEIAMRPF
jgi:hypothetical protein